MIATTVDARGKVCPEPLILTKKALTELTIGQDMQILIDNETSHKNVERFLKDNGARIVTTEEHGLYTITATKLDDAMPAAVAPYCNQTSHVISIPSDSMGRGPADLGAILMKAFVNTIKEVSPLPSTIVFYSSGILLTVEGSPLVEVLRNLEGRGVRILVCGTCADYYGKKSEVRTGTISNMYTILETLTAAGHIITP